MAGNKLLIIDGDPASRDYLAKTLVDAGYEVLRAPSGKEGLIAAWRDHPDLILADPVMADLAGEELAARLRSDSRTAKVPLVALSSDSRPARLQSCRQAGFDDYLVKSPQLVPALIASVGKLLSKGGNAAREGGLLITLLSAKGGTGTSSLCANLAMNMAEDRPEIGVVVADLVLPIGSISGIVGYQSSENLVTIARMTASETTPEFLRRNLPRLEAWRFHLLAGSPDPAHGNDLNVGRIGDIVSALKSVYDLVLLDLGRALSPMSLPLLEHADLVAMIVGADTSTVTLTRTVWDYLRGRGVQAAAVYLILNRAVGLEGVTKAEAEKIIGLPIQSAVPYLGGNVSLANNQHQPYCLKFPADTASIILKDTARQMVTLAGHLRAG